jgi:hypothetical protein
MPAAQSPDMHRCVRLALQAQTVQNGNQHCDPRDQSIANTTPSYLSSA